MIRIYGDFMKIDYEGRVVLTFGSFRDLEKNKIKPENGLRLALYNEDETDDGVRDDLVVEGVLEYDNENKRWAAKIDWDAIKNISKLSPQEKERLDIE